MLECRITVADLPLGFDLFGRVLIRFEAEAGTLAVTAVRDELGRDELYKLSEAYARIKPHLKRFERVTGKDADQPLILSGDMFENVSVRIEGDAVVVEIAQGNGVDEKDGCDYAELWEMRTEYLERAFAVVEPLLADVLTQIINEELM